MNSFFLCALLCAVGDQALMDAVELKQKILAHAERLTGLRVVARTTGYEDNTVHSAYFQKEFTAQSPGLLTFRSGHGHTRLHWQDDPYQQWTHVGPNSAYNIYMVDRTFFPIEMAEDDPLPGTLEGEDFFAATGLWPLRNRPGIQYLGHPMVLREVAATAEYSLVRPQQELVQERWCHVLEWPGLDVLWIDVERGFSVLQRELFQPDKGTLDQRIHTGDHRELEPGIWVPGWYTRTVFDHISEQQTGKRTMARRSRTDIIEAELVQYADSHFTFDPPDGYLKLVRGRQPEPVGNGGTQLLDEIAAWSMRTHASPSLQQERPWLERRMAFAAAAIIALALFAMYRSSPT